MYDTIGLDEAHPDVGFTAHQVAEIMTAWSRPTGTVMGDGSAIRLSLNTTSVAEGIDAKLLSYSGDGGCPTGSVLQLDVVMTTTGTVGGFDISGSRTATMEASSLSEGRISFQDGASDSYNAIVDPELGVLLGELSDKDALDAPVETWKWQVGPEPSSTSTWESAVSYGEISVRTPDTADGARIKLVDYEATVAGLTTTPGQ